MSKRNPEVVVDWLGGYAFVASDDSGHSVVFDAPEKGVIPRGNTPMQGLLACLGACSGMDVVAVLNKRKQKVTSLKVSVTGQRPEYGYPKPYTSITLRYAVTGERLENKFVEEAVKESMEKYCSVAATLNGRAKIDYAYEIIEG